MIMAMSRVLPGQLRAIRAGFWLGVLGCVLSARLFATEPVGVVVQHRGEVTAIRQGRVGTDPGRLDLLYPGDRWRTGASGHLILKLRDDTLLVVDANTELQFSDHDAARVHLVLADGSLRLRPATAVPGSTPGLGLVAPGSRVSPDWPTTPSRVALSNAGDLLLTPLTDRAELLAASQLRPAQWQWWTPDDARPGREAALGVLAVPVLITNYRQRTSLEVPRSVYEQAARLDSPPSPPAVVASDESPPEPASGWPEHPVSPPLSDAERYQQGLDATLGQLAAMLNAGRQAQAAALADARRAKYEGEPDYDLLYGRAILNQGRFQAASFALERSLIAYPQEPVIRLTLVEAYLGMGNTQASGRQLERLAGAALTPEQQSRRARLASLHARLIQKDRLQTLRSVSGQGFYNSNLNQGLACDTCALTPQFSYTPDSDSRAQSGAGVSLQGRYDRYQPVSQRRMQVFQAGLNARLTTWPEAQSLGGLISFGQEWADTGRLYAQLLPGWSPDQVSLAGVVTGGRDQVLGSLDATASLRVSGTTQDQQTLNLNAGLGDDLALASWPDTWAVRWQADLLGQAGNTASQAYVGTRLRLSPHWQPPGLWALQASLSYTLQQYTQATNFEDESQRLHLWALQAQGLRSLGEQTQVSVTGSWDAVVGNQPLAEYQALELALGVQHQW